MSYGSSTSSTCASLAETFLCRNPSIGSSSSSDCEDSNRLKLLAEYLALQPSSAVRQAVVLESSTCRTIDLLASRLSASRAMELPETPSERNLVNSTLARASERVSAGLDSFQTLQDLRRQRNVILSMMYPTHPTLASTLSSSSETRRRVSMLKKAIRDQTQALSKLNDASNLLLLISEHVEILNSCYSSSSASSSSDLSEDDALKVGCMGRSEEPRSSMFVSSVPGNYRMRYLRKCWGFAADALSAAVDLSSYLAKQLEKQGITELVPGIEALSRPSIFKFDFPGAFSLFFRSDFLQKMSSDAKSMREIVQTWQHKQRKFVGGIRRELSRSRRRAGSHDLKLADLRRGLLLSEFADSHVFSSEVVS